MEGKMYPDVPPNPENLPPYYETPYALPQHPSAPVAAGPGAAFVRNPTPSNVISSVMVIPPVGPKPSNMTCRSCGANIVSRVEHKSSTKTHLIALLLCIFGLWCCVCIPYCTDSCQNADHYCPNCNSYIGAYSS